MQERQRSWSVIMNSCRRVSMHRLSHWSGQQQHLLQQMQALGAQEMQWAQGLDKGPWLQMCTVPENCMPLGWQTTQEVQVGPDKLEVVASFCYFGDMLSAVSGCELSTTTRVWNCPEEVQGAATSSLLPPTLFQNTWPHVQLLCTEDNAPCQWDLAIDKA